MIGEFKNANKTAIGNSFTTVYTAPADGAYILQLLLANVDASGIQVSARIRDNSAAIDTYLFKDIPIPNGSSLSVLDNQKVVLEASDYLEVKCETTGKTVDVICSLVANINS